MMATVPHVTSGLGLRKFQADGFLLTRVYLQWKCCVCVPCRLIFKSRTIRMQITSNTRTAEGRQAVPTSKMVIRNVRTKVIRIYLNVSKVRAAVIRGIASAVDIA